MNPQNVLGIRTFADQYMCTNLVEATNGFLQKHFKDVMNTEEFLSLSKSDIMEIISQDELNVSTEEQV